MNSLIGPVGHSQFSGSFFTSFLISINLLFESFVHSRLNEPILKNDCNRLSSLCRLGYWDNTLSKVGQLGIKRRVTFLIFSSSSISSGSVEEKSHLAISCNSRITSTTLASAYLNQLLGFGKCRETGKSGREACVEEDIENSWWEDCIHVVDCLISWSENRGFCEIGPLLA